MNSYQRIALIMGIVFAIVIWNFFVLAQDQERRAILRGLQGCPVVVESLRPEIEQDGLTTKQLQTDTELKFRMAGIKVLSIEELGPFFYLNVQVVKLQPGGWYIYTTSVSLRERVLTMRNGDIIWGTTWQNLGFLGITPNLTDIRREAKDMVDIFINEYLAANPK